MSEDLQGIKFDVQALLEESRGQLVSAIVADAKQRLSWTVGTQLVESVQPVVKEFIQAEVMPELRARLFEQKAVILEAATQAAIEIGEAVAKRLVSDAQSAMQNGYQRTKIMEAIFGK